MVVPFVRSESLRSRTPRCVLLVRFAQGDVRPSVQSLLQAPRQLRRPRQSQAATTPLMVLPQVLRLSDEHQGVLRREHWWGILWHPDAIELP